MKIILQPIGDLHFYNTKLVKDLQKTHKNYEFVAGCVFKTDAKFKLGFFRGQPFFSASLILDYTIKTKQNNCCVFLITKFLLVTEKSITSPLYAGLCYSHDHVLIMSTARLNDYNIILTVANHELGHLFSLDHCNDNNCLMKGGFHGAVIEASQYWCMDCRRQLESYHKKHKLDDR